MLVSLIVAVSDNGVIGRGNDLPWRLPADMRRFKSLTMGHTLVMGRKTYDTVGKPLPGRKTIVLSRTSPTIPGVIVSRTIEAALEEAKRIEPSEIFVAGGAEIYMLALPFVRRMYVTRVGGNVTGDTVVPAFVGGIPPGWDEVAEPEPLDAPGSSHSATLHIYERPEV